MTDYHVTARRDPESGRIVADTNIPGLAIEADTPEAFGLAASQQGRACLRAAARGSLALALAPGLVDAFTIDLTAVLA